MLRILFIIILLSSLGSFSWGCSLCLAPGNTSISPALETAEFVVVARANPKDPQEAKVWKVLKGKLPPSEHSIYFARRILLELRQDDILCIYNEGSWKVLGAAKEASFPVIDHILKKQSSWSLNAEEHLKYIRNFFNHDESLLRDFAFSELARAPYSTISSFANSLSAQELGTLLKNPTFAKWSSLSILISAHSEEPTLKKNIREQLPSLAMSQNKEQLAPWTAALIQLDQEKAFLVIKKFYLDREISYIDMDALVQALSTHGNDGHRHLRPQIIQVYQAMVQKSNRSNLTMIKDLHKWGKGELAEKLFQQSLIHYSTWQQLEMRKFLKETVAEKMIVKQEAAAASAPPESFSAKWLFGALLILPLGFQIYRFKKKQSASKA